jgi:hypothetical protein
MRYWEGVTGKALPGGATGMRYRKALEEDGKHVTPLHNAAQ